MKEIFESYEFKELEKLCHARKVSFILGLSKFSNCIKPKKGASYVMSDFFVDSVPECWDRVQIRPTPPHTWLNPKPPPLLSQPLSQLLLNTQLIKADFRVLWNHLHGVMTESYYCPKLYLTLIPREEVALYVDVEMLPKREFLSCVDIVHFPVFAAWIRSDTLDVDEDEKTRVKFVGLLIHVAFKLYKLDPELHTKPSTSATSDAKMVSGNMDNQEAKSDEGKLPLLRVKKTTEINRELDISSNVDIQILRPPENSEKTSEIHCQKPKKIGDTKDSDSSGKDDKNVNANDPKNKTTNNVITLEPVSEPTTVSSPNEAKRGKINPESTEITSVIRIEDDELLDNSVVNLISDSEEEDSGNQQSMVSRILENNNKTVVEKENNSKSSKDPDVISSLEDTNSEKTKSTDENITSESPLTSVSDNPSPEDRKIIVSDSLGRLIQVCVKLLSQEEYKVLTRKISKYLNYLPEPAKRSVKLASFIDTQCDQLKDDSKNVFVYLKKIFEEMKKLRKDQIESSAEDGSSTKDRAPDKEKIESNGVDDSSAVMGDNTNDPDGGGEEVPSTKDNPEKENNIKLSTEIENCVNGQEEMNPRENPEEVASVTDQKTLKEVLQLFLEECRSNFSSNKEFQPHFKSILKLMDNLDPSHVNSVPLKAFISDHCPNISRENVLHRVEAVSKEIGRYSKTNKRPAEKTETDQTAEPAKKRVCLTSVPSETSETTQSQAENPAEDNQESLPEVRLPFLNPEILGTCDEADKNPQPSSGNASAEAAQIGKEKKNVSKKHIKKLEIALESCKQEIRRLEEAEVDWDDEEGQESNYVLCSRYKRRYMQLFKKIAEAKKMSSNLDRRCDKKFKCTESRYPEINQKISKFINKTKEFPDFQDIKKLVEEANSSLHLSAVAVMEEAENVFRGIGRHLKSRRQADETDVMTSYLKADQQEDPAVKDPELDKILVIQVKEGRKKMNDFLDSFYQRQCAASNEDNEEEEGLEEPIENSEDAGCDE